MKYGKIIALIICVALAAVSVTAATVAYFTDTSADINTFVFGNVKMTLDESKVDENGIPVGTERTTSGNSYKLVPGGSYTKDPTVTVKAGGSEAYIRILVNVSGISAVKEVFGEDFLPENFVEGWNNEIWLYSGTAESENDSAVYEFRYYKTVSASEKDVVLEPLFKKLVIPGDLVDLAGVRKLAEAGVSVSVIGNGIQAAGFASADEAWNAFAEQMQ